MNHAKMGKRLRKLADALEFGELVPNPHTPEKMLAVQIFAKTGDQITTFYVVEGGMYRYQLPTAGLDTEIEIRVVANKL